MGKASVALPFAFALAALLLAGCLGGGSNGAEATATPVPTPVCPGSCQFGCRPGTATCLESPLCPESCPLGCEPGTAACKVPCPPGCQFGCVPGTGECAANAPEGTATPAPEASETPAPEAAATPEPTPAHCNTDLYCDPFLGENDQNCPADCVPVSYCMFQTTGFSAKDFTCKRYRLAGQGLYLEVFYPGNADEDPPIHITGFGCSANASAPVGPAEVELLPGEGAVVAGGVPCYNADGSAFAAEPGGTFTGSLAFEYRKGDEPTTFREVLGFQTVVRGT